MDGLSELRTTSWTLTQVEVSKACSLPQTGQVCSSSLILLCSVLCGLFGSVPLGRASLACLGCPCFGWPLPVRFSCGFFLGAAGLLPFVAAVRWFWWCCCLLFLSDLAAWVLAVWPALSCFPPLPSPLGCLLVLSGPVRLSYLWHGVSWLIGSCLPSASWQQRLRPCVGLCPLHHVVGVVHVPLAAALRYSPSGDPESP